MTLQVHGYMTALRKLLVLGFERLLLATRHGRIEGDSSWCRLVATNCGNDVIELPASDAGDTLFEDLSAFRRGNFGLTHDLGDLVHLGGDLRIVHDGERLVIDLLTRDGLGEVILAEMLGCLSLLVLDGCRGRRDRRRGTCDSGASGRTGG